MHRGNVAPFARPAKGKKPPPLPNNTPEDRDLNEGLSRRQAVPAIRSTVHTTGVTPSPMRFPFKPHIPPRYHPKGSNAIPLSSTSLRRSSPNLRRPDAVLDRTNDDNMAGVVKASYDGASDTSSGYKRRRLGSDLSRSSSPSLKMVEQSIHSSQCTPSTSLAGPSMPILPIPATSEPDSSISEPDVKLEPLSPPLSTGVCTPTAMEGTEFIAMIPECAAGTGGFKESRIAWKNSVRRRVEREGKKVIKMIVRGDGMAIDWVRRSSTPTQSSRTFEDEKESIEISTAEASFLGMRPGKEHEASLPLIQSGRSPTSHQDFSSRNKSEEDGHTTPLQWTQDTAEETGPGRPASNIEQDTSRTESKDARQILLGYYQDNSHDLGNGPMRLHEQSIQALNQKEQSINLGRHPYDDAKEMARSFLMQYFRLFDQNRSALWGAYASNALFSYQICGALPGDTRDRTEDIPSFGDPRSCRNLVTRDDLDILPCNDSGLIYEPGLIVDSLMRMESFELCSPVDESGNRFIWDVIPIPSDGDNTTTLIVCHGDMTSNRDHSKVISFHRSFVVKNNQEDTKDFWPLVILSDQLTIRNYSPAKLWTEDDRL